MTEQTFDLVDLKVGAVASYTREVTAALVDAFAEISGDNNPVHLDEQYAAGTMFKQRIAHGILSVAFISTVLGTKLPGPGAIYLEQVAKFRAPVYLGDTVTATVEVEEYDEESGRAKLKTVCHNQDGTVLIEGSAKILYKQG